MTMNIKREDLDPLDEIKDDGECHTLEIPWSLSHITLVPFNFTMEVTNKLKGIRVIEIIPSAILWYQLEQKIAEMLNIYPTSLHAQYRFSTDNKESLPCDLTSAHHLGTMITLLCALVVPAILATGHCSTRQLKKVTV